jgi:hypothetical protein
MMDLADTPREGDLDGRGNLSRRCLREFVGWFLRVCLDQVLFTTSQFQLDDLGRRLVDHGRRLGLRAEALTVLGELVVRGALTRGEATRLTRMSERLGRQIVNELLRLGLVASDTPKGPLYLRFSVESAESLFPTLFPST